jgi:sulfoacetaldehyde dehydrogenase
MEDNQELIEARQEIEEMMARARAAQAQIDDYSQEQVNELITAMVWAVAREDRSEEIAQFTVEETQLGNYAGKYLKIHRKTRATLMDQDCQAGGRDRRPVALHQPRGDSGDQGDLGG